jgi:hypothetical protein
MQVCQSVAGRVLFTTFYRNSNVNDHVFGATSRHLQRLEVYTIPVIGI